MPSAVFTLTSFSTTLDCASAGAGDAGGGHGHGRKAAPRKPGIGDKAGVNEFIAHGVSPSRWGAQADARPRKLSSTAGCGWIMADSGRALARAFSFVRTADEGKMAHPKGFRTPDPQIRSLVLYPAELRVRFEGANLFRTLPKGKDHRRRPAASAAHPPDSAQVPVKRAVFHPKRHCAPLSPPAPLVKTDGQGPPAAKARTGLGFGAILHVGRWGPGSGAGQRRA